MFGDFFDCLSSYLTTYTSRRVNYSTQQTSSFWQKIPGSERLLLRAEIRNVDLISCFPFLIAVAALKGGEERNIPFGPFASHICTHACADLLTCTVDVFDKYIWYPNTLKAKWSLKSIPPSFHQQTRYSRCNIINKAWWPEACLSWFLCMCMWASKVIKTNARHRRVGINKQTFDRKQKRSIIGCTLSHTQQSNHLVFQLLLAGIKCEGKS